MKTKVILDTSPLVAFIDKGDNFHHWTRETWKNLRMSELIEGSSILTLDSDFRIYRKHKNETIDVIISDEL
ncbi:hypothetical protein [Floridanema evergladense]|uniref:PIN domain-containing protein n=1 Tax=Floridaenema evergladense BLCC-F167 TaxID=3153639 RepID=A0ABV4WVN5_9CYAN